MQEIQPTYVHVVCMYTHVNHSPDDWPALKLHLMRSVLPQDQSHAVHLTQIPTEGVRWDSWAAVARGRSTAVQHTIALVSFAVHLVILTQ